MQLSVALSLHYGWDSQLNTSEMFWIDISRWMISSRYWWISVYLLWRTAHALNLNLSCNVVSIGLRSWSCQLPSCNSFTSHSCFIVFWERDITSEHHETPVHITIIDHIHYLLSVITYYCKNYLSLLSLLLILCELQGRRDWQPLCTRWEQSYLYLCAGPRWLLIAPLAIDTYLLNLGVSGDSILGIFAKGKHFYLLHLTPSTWGNQRGVRGPSRSIFWRRCRGLHSSG